jgi:hypothetical protein
MTHNLHILRCILVRPSERREWQQLVVKKAITHYESIRFI